MAELVDAGAPELPTGYFYRVKRASLGLLSVEIRHQGRFWSSRVEDVYVCPGDFPTSREALASACRRAFDYWQRQQTDAAALFAACVHLGDHDPKGR
ncbi:hypothetical protein [Streptomyces sp. NPDC004528]|uniref:hypothetical protein n=1 Tax=Streptomyces sp. NPDC004528 TaxID=3154550 RepID=UPI00339FB150